MNLFFKANLIALYLLAIAGRWVELPWHSGAVLQRVAAIVLIVHAVELLWAWRHVKRYAGPLTVSVVLTLLFGLFHWRPLALAARAFERSAPVNTPRVPRWLSGLAFYGAAMALGLGSAWWFLKKAPFLNTAITVGAWKTDMLVGHADAGLYTRATVALNALLALGREETMYYMAARDDAGQPLRATCSYLIEGTPPLARWWSITAYADDLFLFDAPNQRYSLNATQTRLDPQGRFSVRTGPAALGEHKHKTHWLPTQGERGLILILRLYNPDAALQAAPAQLIPPSIRAVGACP